ncbi:MAG: cytochrome-c peroxidase, partial [Roseivirga sp.]|nr:cytochrome-c peroxidase [Roseivirga sp.]
MRKKWIIMLLASASMFACQQEGEDLDLDSDFSEVISLPDEPYNYSNIDLPAHFVTNEVRAIDNTPVDNLVTDAGATLGRV